MFTGSFQEAGVIQAAYNLNNPLFVHQQSIGSLSSRGFFSLSSQQVVLDTVKKVSLQWIIQCLLINRV